MKTKNIEVNIFAECLDANYYEPLYHLERKGKIKIKVYDSRFIYLLAKYLRFGKTPKKVKIKEIFNSLFAPIILLFKKDILVAFSPYSLWIYYLSLLRILNKNLISRVSWTFWDNKKRYIHRPVFNYCLWKNFIINTKTFVTTKKTFDQIKDLGGKPFYFNKLIDSNKFKPNKNIKVKKQFLYVGRIIKEKGILDIIEVAKHFKNFNFIFVGNGNLKDKLIGDNIKYLGYINKNKELNKLIKLYQESYCLILNSYETEKWEEFLGIVILESMACGLPVISTNCTGPKDIIKDGYNGFLIKQKSKKDLKNKINLVISNQKLINKIRKNARKTAEKYDFHLFENELINIIKN